MLKVVLIDDEKYVLKSLQNRIDWAKSGYEVIGTAGNGTEGAELVRSLRPDVVFTDIRMPGMDGIELIRMLSAELPQTFFVVISGYAEFEYAKKAIEYGVKGFCTKPFDEEEITDLLSRIRKTIRKREDGGDDAVRKDLRLSDLTSGDCRELLLKHGMEPYGRKVVVVFPGGESPSLWMNFKMLRFTVDERYDAYLVAANSVEGPVIRSQDNRGIGVSRLFMDVGAIANAVEEARAASWQSFVNGEAINVYRPFTEAERESRLLDLLRTRYETGEYNEVLQVFDQLEAAFRGDRLTMRSAVRLYALVMALLRRPETENPDPSGLTARFSNVYAMLDELRTLLENSMLGVDREVHTIISDVLVYLNRNYSDSTLNVEKLSRLFGFNPNYLSQLFKKTRQVKFTTYLTNLRIEHAKELLKKSEYPISVIAGKVGYTEYFYFAKVFRKIVGETPGDYRKNRLENSGGGVKKG